MLPNASWREETLQLESGDLLVLYTDGVTEAADEAEEEFGLDRLSAAVQAGRGLTARQLCDDLMARVADFARGMPQYDDQTLLLLRRN
jgi:sigma-B regulation protein RsbU (phosphoserine phosphatase)